VIRRFKNNSRSYEDEAVDEEEEEAAAKDDTAGVAPEVGALDSAASSTLALISRRGSISSV